MKSPRDPTGGPLEPLLSIDDVAAICGVPRRTCERWLYERTGPASLKVGRYRRFRRSAVEAWLESRTG